MTMKILAGLLVLIVCTSAEEDVACKKLDECLQIAHDQVVECKNLLSRSSTQTPKQQCEAQLKEKQQSYLDKLSQKGVQFKNCLATKPTPTRLVRGARRKGNKQNGQQQCTAAVLTGLRLRPVKQFRDGAETGGQTERKKQSARKLKQCLQQVQSAKNQCKQPLKCCAHAKSCQEQSKSSALATELKQLQRQLSDAKKTCKAGGRHRAKPEPAEEEGEEEETDARRV